ncbi:MAG: ATP cone domain-containing protein [Candidatus Saccharimonadia bacterium]
MKCPFCRETKTDVYNSRATNAQNQVWRRRRCLSCGQSFTSYEQPDLRYLLVGDKNGKTGHFSRPRLFSSIYEAFESSHATPETIDAVTDTVEEKILDLKQSIITSKQIATIILITLKHFHAPAFLRYLSGHTELNSSAEIKKILKAF